MSIADRPFKDFLADHEAKFDLLPVLHTTNSRTFRELLLAGSLRPQKCKVFSDEILYLFYGRPAYRTASGRVGFMAKFAAPVVFIFRPEVTSKKLREVYLFDTGAFERGMYSSFFDKNHSLGSLSMGDEIDSASRMVNAFYSSNEDYLRNISSKNPEIHPFDFTADGVYSIINSTQFESPDSSNLRDERATSIEVQVIDEINLEGDDFLGIIVPSTFSTIPEVGAALDRWSPKHVKFYESTSVQNYEFWHGQIFAKALEVYKEAGCLE